MLAMHEPCPSQPAETAISSCNSDYAVCMFTKQLALLSVSQSVIAISITYLILQCLCIIKVTCSTYIWVNGDVKEDKVIFVILVF